jgi:hypothetical protein
MKFPSIKNLAKGAVETIKRYPFEVLFALAGTIAGTIQVELSHLNRENEGWCLRSIMIANLGFLLSLSATLYTQSIDMPILKRRGLKWLAAVLAGSLIFIIDPSTREADYMRFFLMSLAFHLMVAFAAFTRHGQVQGFWQFNKTLFLRFLISALYGAVLFGGLAAAIGATNFLFNFKFEWDTYVILWVWIAGIFTTIFFLAGVPTDTHSLNDDLSYPKGLKIFTQYVLIPLSTVYAVILLAYEVKILVQWNLPKGLVSNLILGYAVFGILSLLLVYPIREQDENKWLKTYTRSFYFLLVPLLGLLFVAVGTRVFKYGITEWRYFLIVLACWLLFISVYFLFFKKHNIKLIPISLSILTLLAIYGPQSAFSVSMYSQRRIVLRFFEKHNAFKNGKLTPVDSTKISDKDGSRAVANLDYFISKYDILPLQPYINKDLTIVTDSLGKKKGKSYGDITSNRYEFRSDKLEWAKNYLGLHKFEPYYRGEDEMVASPGYTFTSNENIMVIKGYDLSLAADNSADTVINNYSGIKITQINLNNKQRIIKLNNDAFKFDVAALARKLMADSVQMKRYLQPNKGEYMPKTYILPRGMLALNQETDRYQVSFIVDNIRFDQLKEKLPPVTYASGTYLIRIK